MYVCMYSGRYDKHQNFITSIVDFPLEKQSNYSLTSCFYCAFLKHTNSEVQKLPSQYCIFCLPSIIYYDHKQWPLKHRNTQNASKSTNHKPWPFEHIKVKFCFLRGRLRWLMAAKNANISWLLDIGLCVFLKSTVKCTVHQY